jgi:hypothetical protein
MATNRKRVARKREVDIAPELLAWFKDATPCRPALVYFMQAGELQAAWDASRDAVLAEWIQTNPGTRPAHWWLFDAPEQRHRIGGKGTPCHEVLAYAPAFNLGIPAAWIIDQQTADRVNVERYDPTDPPAYESQAAFLKRNKLFLSGEEGRLAADAYAPAPETECSNRRSNT